MLGPRFGFSSARNQRLGRPQAWFLASQPFGPFGATGRLPFGMFTGHCARGPGHGPGMGGGDLPSCTRVGYYDLWFALNLYHDFLHFIPNLEIGGACKFENPGFLA